MAMTKKVLLVAFKGEPMCFVHVLLNALDMTEKGYEVKVVIEGTATQAAAELSDPGKPFAKLYQRVREAGLIDCACQACSAKIGVLTLLQAQGLAMCAEMSGHPSLAKYVEQGYEVITF
jgi:hypothetical protein